MKELFDKFKKISLYQAKNLNFIDTCLFISVFEHNDKVNDFKKLKNKAMTSFNVQELIKVNKKLGHTKHSIRKFLENAENDELTIIDVGVLPGERETEKQFVNSIEPKLLKHCQDPSDAVLIAAAIKTRSNLFTKDKHHIFNVDLENFANKHNIKIYKELSDVIF